MFVCWHLQVGVQSARTQELTEESSRRFGRTSERRRCWSDAGAVCEVSSDVQELQWEQNSKIVYIWRIKWRSWTSVFVLWRQSRYCAVVFVFRQSFEYLLNFRSTMPSLNTALCLSQLLSTVSEKGGNAAAHRDQTGQTDMLLSVLFSLLWSTRIEKWILSFFSSCFCLNSFPRTPLPEPGLGNSQWREGAREQIQWGPARPPYVSRCLSDT